MLKPLFLGFQYLLSITFDLYNAGAGGCACRVLGRLQAMERKQSAMAAGAQRAMQLATGHPTPTWRAAADANGARLDERPGGPAAGWTLVDWHGHLSHPSDDSVRE